MKQLWAGRFAKEIDKNVLNFTSSIGLDQRLYKYDIQGSIAHVQMLGKVGIIKKVEVAKITSGLRQILKEIETGKIKFSAGEEDIHMAIEQRLIAKIGPVGEKLHTGRSRNDQVALDMKLYLRDQINLFSDLIKNIQSVILELARKNIKVVMPGFTHLQHAQPVLFSHHLMAYYFMLKRDHQRLVDCLGRVNILPLGAAALAGTELPIDRQYVNKVLSFSAVSENSIDTVSDRDFVIEFLSTCSILMMHLSRLSEEIVLWSTEEFNFIELDDAFCTGSSIMPQKKNPDVAELIRGKTGQVYGNLMAVLTMMKSLPLSYNRDMQEDKKSLFDTIDTTKSVLKILPGLLKTMKINGKRMSEVMRRGFLNATDASNYLVAKGIPFRQAHAIIGGAVKYCLLTNKRMEDLSLNEFKKFSPKFGPDILKKIKIENCLANKRSLGGTSPQEVLRTIKKEAAGLKY
jgi:argininosuccinate lyase